MASPVPSRARRDFGFSSQPYEKAFPNAPAMSRYALGLTGYHPLEEVRAQNIADAEMAVAMGDLSSPSAVLGLQRLVGQGVIDPRQANSIAALQRVSQLQNKAIAPKEYKPSPTIQKSVASYLRKPSDAEKIKAYKEVKKETPKTDEQWGEAWHMAMDPAKEALLAELDAVEMTGGVLPPNLLQLRDKIRGGAPAATQSPAGVSQAPQATSATPDALDASGLTREQVMQLPAGTPIRMPDGSIKRKK